MATKEINLLPPTRRQQLRNETVVVSLQRFVGSLNIALTGVTVCAVVAAIALTVAIPLVGRQGTDALDEVLQEYQQLQTVVTEQNRILTQLSLLGSERIVWTARMREIIPLLPSGVRIQYLAGNNDAGGVGPAGQPQLILRGQAATRTTLVLLQNRLQDLSFIEQVISPTSNLIERENVNYDLTLVITKEHGE